MEYKSWKNLDTSDHITPIIKKFYYDSVSRLEELGQVVDKEEPTMENWNKNIKLMHQINAHRQAEKDNQELIRKARAKYF
jgi:hypothetical protein